ncbi:MAG: segregation/condensation protein A [Clostridia bacterium]|nr:segregation/condensation protein A [Clostridia bacterium]
MENEEIINNFEDDYQFKLENFEGPLDLLLEIIKKNKMDIAEVKLAELTGQYLEFLNNLKNLDMEKASDFITMAATLIEIKSKSLLPRLDEVQEDEEDSEMLLLNRLKEYKIFKEAGESLKSIENIDRMYKNPDENVGNPKIVLKDMVLDKLLDAFVGILTKSDKKVLEEKPKEIAKDRFTVAEKISSTKKALKEKKQVNFEDLFEEGQTKSELINIFLALLELLKMQIAKIKQDGLFQKIIIFLNEDLEG